MKNRAGSVFLLIVLFFGLPVSDAAAQSDKALRDCRAIADPAARLGCYDAIADRLLAPTTPSAPVAMPMTKPAGDGAAPSDTNVAPDTAAAQPAPAPAPMVADQTRNPPKVATPVAPATPVATTADDNDFGGEQLEPETESPDTLVSRIVGDYDGWWGNTVFRLENGQTWVQAQAGKSRYRGAPNPTVTIRRRALGSYRLQVEGSNKTVRVKRLK